MPAVKTLLSRFRGRRAKGAHEEVTDSVLASSIFPPDEPHAVVTWPARQQELKSAPAPSLEAAQRIVQLWRADAPLAALGDAAATRLASLLQAASIAPEQEPIRQDETGDFLMILLEGRVAVERRHPGGGRTRLMEARAGDLLGEMALFDGGPRFSACRTLTHCSVAVLDNAALRRMIEDDAPLAAALLVSITRRLSLRLRQTGARLSALLAPQ